MEPEHKPTPAAGTLDTDDKDTAVEVPVAQEHMMKEDNNPPAQSGQESSESEEASEPVAEENNSDESKEEDDDTEPTTKLPAAVEKSNPSNNTKEFVVKAGHTEEVIVYEEAGTLVYHRQLTNKTAVLVLAMGLSITAILLIFVGCRLRNVKRRLRRGRPLNSNEADYLINGMYL